MNPDLNRIIQTVLVALLAWNIYTTHELSIGVALLNEKLVTLKEQVEDISNESTLP